MARVELQQLSKAFGDTMAVENVDLAVEDREFMVLVGPSGCGKSTILRMIAGLEDPTHGTILIDGKRVNDLAPKDRDIAMVFQNYALYPHMSVFDNMGFSLKLRRYPKSEIRERVREAANTLGLIEVLDRRPAQLSGGQRQRVAVGRAIVREPKVFLFDEPLSNLDAKLRNQTRAELARLHHQLQATMIYVTHDQVEAMTMGTRIAALNEGRLQQADKPLELYAHPRNLFVAGFIGSPSMNLFAGRMHDRSFHCPEFEFEVPSQVVTAEPPTEVTFGIRPEHLVITTHAAGRVHLSGEVELLEPLGAETYAHVRVGERLVTARLAGEVDIEHGARIELHFDPVAGHFFDTTSGDRLA